jgi:hypothetical protein
LLGLVLDLLSHVAHFALVGCQAVVVVVVVVDVDTL